MVTKKHSKDKKASEYLKSLCQKRVPLAKGEELPIKPDKLTELIEKASQNARQNYSKLSKPKTCNLSTYINYWVQEAVLSELIKKTLIKVDLGDSSRHYDLLTEAVVNYLSLLPMDEMEKLRREILTPLPYNKRERVWKRNKPLVGRLEKAFVDLAVVRNKSAQKKGYEQYPKLILTTDQVPKSVYEEFNQNVDRIINQIHQQLPGLADLPDWFYSSLNLPCFICQLPFPDLKIPKEVFDAVEKEYPLLKDYHHKLSVYFGDQTRIKYEKKTDGFRIELSKRENKRHQAIGLVHELGHTIAMIKEFKKGKTPLETDRYKAEKMASEIELKLLKKLSPMVLKGRLGDILLVFHRVLFEMAVYENPKQDLPRLYAKIFNHCFPEAKQESNQLYLLDEDIVLKPLSSLPQAIVYAELLSKKKFL